MPLRVVFCASLYFAVPALAAPDFSAVRDILKAAVADGKIAGGSVLILHRGSVVFGEGFGFADRKTGVPFLLDTPAAIASISKPLLGTVAFRLSEKGALDLSRPISAILPEFNDPRLASGVAVPRAPSTLELFTHTSGMRADEAPGGRPWFASWTRDLPLGEVVKRFAADYPFAAEPGRRYAYSGIGTDVAARVLEVAADRPRNALLVAELAGPLGMAHTFYRHSVTVTQLGKMPTRYHLGKKGELLPDRARLLPGPNDYSASGGCVLSTAPDLARWLLMIRNGGIHDGRPFLAPETISEMLSRFPCSSTARGGLAIRKRDADGKATVLGHTGSSGTDCWIDFENDIIGIVLTQTSGPQLKPFRFALEKRITEALATPSAVTPDA